jgi:TrmH family RNA methyltransferase
MVTTRMPAVRAHPITSASNPRLKEIRRALRAGSLTRDGLCVIEGWRLIGEALHSGLAIEAVYASEPPPFALAFHEVPDRALGAIATTETSPRAIALVRPPEFRPDQVFRSPALAVLLDGIQNPGNAGTILRTAEAFSATGAVLLAGTVSRWNPKLLRAASGSAFRLPVVAGPVEVPVRMFAADPHRGAPPWEVDFRQPCAIAVGSEARGLSAELRAKAVPVRIPTAAVESLNAAVAASILLYEAAKQRGTV